MGSSESVSSECAVKRGRLTVFFLLHVQAKVTHMPDVLKMCECGNKGKRRGKKQIAPSVRFSEGESSCHLLCLV